MLKLSYPEAGTAAAAGILPVCLKRDEIMKNAQLKAASVSAPGASISSFDGLRALGFLGIFWWHGFTTPPVDLGARICEFFFIISGFLVYYKYGQTDSFRSFSDSTRYLKKKLAAMYPLHVLTFLLAFLNALRSQNLTPTLLTSIPFNLTLTHAWCQSPTVFFSFNGVSWYLSALMFCYLLAPVVLKCLRSVKGSLLPVVLLGVLRVATEHIDTTFSGEFLALQYHVNPAVRLLEFSIGAAVCKLFLHAPKAEKSKKSFALFSLLELLVCGLVTGLCIRFNATWLRGGYVLLCAALILVFSYNAGAVSRLLSCRIFAPITGLQYELYMIHQLILVTIPKRLFPLNGLHGVTCLVLSFALAWLYKKYLYRPLASLMTRLLKCAG